MSGERASANEPDERTREWLKAERPLTASEIRRAVYKLKMEDPTNRLDEIIVLLREIAAQGAER